MIDTIESLLPGHIRIFNNRAVIGPLGDCWGWTGTLDRDGYAVARARDSVTRRSIQVGAHRIAYLLTHGSVDPEAVIDHLCRNRACVNPDHLEPVTNRENIRRGDLTNHETCRNGRHPWTPESFRVVSGRRICKACNREAVRRYQQRKKSAPPDASS